MMVQAFFDWLGNVFSADMFKKDGLTDERICNFGCHFRPGPRLLYAACSFIGCRVLNLRRTKTEALRKSKVDVSVMSHDSNFRS